MRRKSSLIMFLTLLCGGGLVAYAAQNNAAPTFSGPVSINSTTVPVGVIPPALMTTFEITNWDSTNAVLCFPYTGSTVPTAVPSPSPEHFIGPKTTFADAVNCSQTNCNDGMGYGWACVEQSAGQVNVDGCYR